MAGITRLGPEGLTRAAPDLAALLVDAVDGGASLGYLAPLDPDEALGWWLARRDAVASGGLLLWAALDGDRAVGTVQVEPAAKANGRHRGEVAKLVVHRDARGRGLGRALLSAAERGAAEAGLTLLVLDTETGSPAEHLYRSAGWVEVGTIPDYAADPSGALRPTTLFHRLLG